MGYDPKDIPSPFPNTLVPEAGKRMQGLQHARDDAIAAHEIARQYMINRDGRGVPSFKEGDSVWVSTKNLLRTTDNRKFQPRRTGPFLVAKKLGRQTYELVLEDEWKNIHNSFDITLLKAHEENEIHGPNFIQPPPETVEGHDEYEVETIVAHQNDKRYTGGIKFKVRWKGYSSASDTFIDAEDLGNAREVLDEYKKRHNLP